MVTNPWQSEKTSLHDIDNIFHNYNKIVKTEQPSVKAEEESHNKNITKEVWDYMKVRKKWWLLPLIILFLIAGALIIFGQAGGSVSTFIYALG